MPSFDTVSQVDLQELSNALNQARKEIETRYDLKQTRSEIEEPKPGELMIISNDEFTLKQVTDVLTSKMAKRGIPLQNLKEAEKIEAASDGRVKRALTLQQGIPQETAKKITKLIKDTKMKVQASIQGDQVRVSGKKRDDLQEAIALLKKQDLGIALQFTNFRD